MPPSPAYAFAVAAADRYLDDVPADPQEAHDRLVKIINGAMIEEGQQARRYMCPKCFTAYNISRARRPT